MQDNENKPMFKAEYLPEYLKERPIWCLWKYEDRLNKKTGELSQTKVPYNPRTLGHAQSTNKNTFADLATAQEVLNHNSGFDGLGVGVFDGLSAIDIDHCIKDGVYTDFAADIIESMNTYTEVSPSGEGLRLFFLAPDFEYDKEAFYINNQEAGKRAGYGDEGLEVYVCGCTNKFLTVTGNVISGGEPEDRAEQLGAILEKYMKRPPKPNAKQQQRQASQEPTSLNDRELLDLAMNASNGAKFSSLWNGLIDDYASQSEADQALCNLLAFWTGRDALRMDALFRTSALMRDKWDELRGAETYGAMTINNAISSCNSVYEPKKQKSNSNTQTVDINSNASEYSQESAVLSLDDFISDIQGEKYRPLETGMQSLDKILGGGIMRQSLIVLSAAPGAGKTAFASQVFEQFAANGNPVLFLNLEMSREYLLARSLSRMLYRTGYNMTATDILRGYKWSEDQRAHVLDIAADYRRRIAPNLDYNPHGSTSDIFDIELALDKIAAQYISSGRPAPVVVLDYLHLLTADRMDAQETIKAGVSMLKNYAIKNNTFVLAIAANNRESNRSGNISQSSARDSSAIEYTADIQISLNYRALEDGETKPNSSDKYRADNPSDMDLLMNEKPRRMVMRVLKNRMNAAGGKLYLNFDAAHSIFEPLATSSKGNTNSSADDVLSWVVQRRAEKARKAQ